MRFPRRHLSIAAPATSEPGVRGVSGGYCCLVGTRRCSNGGRWTPGAIIPLEARLCNGTGVLGDGVADQQGPWSLLPPVDPLQRGS